MVLQQRKLGIREYVSISILMAGAKATEDTPTMLYKGVQNAAWMIPILAAGIFFIPFLLLNKTLLLYQNKDLFSVIVKLLGKYIGTCVCLLIFLISSIGISFDTRTYTNIVRTFYFPTTPTFVIYAILMAVCAYGAKKGIHHIGSVSYLIIFYFVIFFCIALMLSAQSSSIRAMFPILGPGPFKIIKDSVRGLSLFADFFLLTMIIPFIRSRKEVRKGTWISYLFITFQLSVAVLVYICLFDTSLGTIGYPFHTLIRFISLGSYLPNVEIIFFVIWILSAFIRFTVFLYINGMMFGHIFKIKDIEYLIPALAMIYLLIGSMPESSIEIAQSKLVVIAAVGPVFTIISVILWLAAVLRGEFKHAKNRNSM
ncbi:spore germination protein (amino acid permease) [Neobacillus bataviensis]|uniref:Spore germination protein (Amino acid permease) n=1 Tax=Neobacillus bataviensis TaxID=220685 RepID=A0A561DNR1_9BACI|nr:GerAB/ArcD/ProY family transporter [Neobacillus bataviensis]TWE05003.1 spore germination protein (amino acid permease) [Neobacillus bataviensis]